MFVPHAVGTGLQQCRASLGCLQHAVVTALVANMPIALKCCLLVVSIVPHHALHRHNELCHNIPLRWGCTVLS